jgi:hypothetical protein
MSSPAIVLQTGFSARPSLQRRTARSEFYKPLGAVLVLLLLMRTTPGGKKVNGKLTRRYGYNRIPTA